MRLRETLVAYMLPLLVLPVMAFGYLAYQFSKEYWQQQAYYQAEKSLSQQQLALTSFLQLQQTRLAMLAHSPLLQQHVQRPDQATLQALQAKPATADVFQDFSERSTKPGTTHDIEFILDIPVQLTVELGRTRIPIKHILQLAQGSVVELEALAGEPMDVLVNGYLIAQGEVVVVNDKFGIRLTDIVTPSERMRRVSRS